MATPGEMAPLVPRPTPRPAGSPLTPKNPLIADGDGKANPRGDVDCEADADADAVDGGVGIVNGNPVGVVDDERPKEEAPVPAADGGVFGEYL